MAHVGKEGGAKFFGDFEVMRRWGRQAGELRRVASKSEYQTLPDVLHRKSYMSPNH